MTAHLSVDELALHLDGRLSPAQQARLDQHLAECDDCRTELVELSRVLRTAPRRKRWYVPVGAVAAAAAVVALLVWPGSQEQPNHREPAVTMAPAPVGIAPRGPTTGTPRLVWTSVPHAARYRLTVFDSTGAVIWESQTKDTSVEVVASTLRRRVRYFWQVAAETGFDRWIRSDMVEFVIQP
jgi:anti-sigma factor RsiW